VAGRASSDSGLRVSASPCLPPFAAAEWAGGGRGAAGRGLHPALSTATAKAGALPAPREPSPASDGRLPPRPPGALSKTPALGHSSASIPGARSGWAQGAPLMSALEGYLSRGQTQLQRGRGTAQK
jgi:hypothetical protein